MDSLIEKLNVVLKDHFPNADTELETVEETDRISGFLIWDGFSGKDQLERQQQVWRMLRKELTPGDRRRISAILTTTCDEMAAMREG